MNQQRTLTFMSIVILVLVTLTVVPATHAQSERCFPETGFCISGPIRQYWEQNGGVPVFGYPISDQHVETIEGWTGPVQWFERDRLEDHGADGVLAGRLGAKMLEMNDRPWQTYPSVGSAPEGCLYFSQTGHSLCEPFKSYWEQNGGLARFGYPITEPHTEVIDDWSGTVQYFERRRMEHHPENAGTPYEILLGLLGRAVYEQQGECEPVMDELESVYNRLEFSNALGCPQEVYTDRSAAIQNMENGIMIWMNYSEDNQKIYTVPNWGAPREYNDTWTPDTQPPDVDPPSNLFTPQRGFGKVWNDDPMVRNELGWAIEKTERPETATVQTFEDGFLIWMKGSDVVYALGPWISQTMSRQP
jgi:hypothetical protein